MGRAGYSEDCDDTWALIRWRGQVASAIKGKRGQALLKELLIALESMPEKKLVATELKTPTGEVCALGAVGVARKMDLDSLDPYDYDMVADAFGVAHQLVREIEYQNDEGGWFDETPEQRWQRMHEWVKERIVEGGEKFGEVGET